MILVVSRRRINKKEIHTYRKKNLTKKAWFDANMMMKIEMTENLFC